MKECFIICPIGNEGSEIRKISDKFYEYVLKPVLAPLDYEPVRADHIGEVGIITSQVINHILDAPLVIADLSGANPNVFYELGIRHTIGKPYIQFIDKNEKLPFDIAAVRSISIDLTDLYSVDAAKEQLRKQIESYESGIDVHSPVSATIDIRNLKMDKNLVENLVQKIYDLESQLKKTEDDIKSFIMLWSD